jgi:outer membrane protein assembly factor BamD (BamD/ComL family)
VSSGAANVGTAAPSYGRLREIYARQGDVLQVGLDGVGFLFLGFPDAKGQADGMSFKSKENRNNKTWFTFQALKIGTYDLDFLQQDNMAGKTSKETVRVHVVTDQDFNAAVAPPTGTDAAGTTAVETGDPVFAQRLSTLGSYQAAVVELLKGYKDGNPSLNDQIAALYMKMGSYEAAGKYYGKNIAPQTPFTPAAVIGLVRIAALQNDQQGLLSNLRQFLALQDPAMEEPLIQSVRMEKNRSEIGMALDLASEYTKRFPDGTWRDEADYLAAQLLEADSPARDLARARQLYGGIVTGRPESPFADAARQRLQYIDRHFFQVR